MKNLVQFLLVFTFILQSFTSSYSQVISEISAESAGLSTERLDRYNEFLTKEIEEGHTAGAVSLVMRKGQIAHMTALGYSSLDDKTTMHQDQIFYIQSMTKPIITVAFMMLYEEGHFLLSDPVSKYLPEFKNIEVVKDIESGANGETEPLNTEITISHLLSHTAGFSHGLGSSQLDQDIVKELYYKPHKDIDSRVDALISMPLVGQPGEQWYYSAAPDVLSLLIENFSGMSTNDFLVKRILTPLGMKDTGYNISKDNQQRMAPVHIVNKEGSLINNPRQTPMEGNMVYGGTHGLFSTAADYMIFCQMMLNNGEWNGTRFLSRKTIELMTTNHVGELFGTTGQGFGLGFAVTTDVAKSNALGSVGQYYWSGAYCTYFFIDPHEELIAILMTQTAPYSNYYGDKMRQFVYQAIID